MEARPRPSPPEKKPPLSDRTNFTVPTSTVLSNLKSSLSSSSKPPPPNPNPNYEPHNSTPLDCSESETSVGSSNFNEIDWNPGSLSLTAHSTPRRVPLVDFEKTRVKGKPAAVSTGEAKDTKKVMFMPVNCSSMVSTRNKKKENVETFSCPPLPRTRRKRTVYNEAGNTIVSHSFVPPQPKQNEKKRQLLVKEDDSVHALLQEYIEQQRAYFQEVDDFELVAEVLENESDNEDANGENQMTLYVQLS